MYKLKTNYKKIISDTLTPVSIYLRLRDKFHNAILLESSDYHANDNSFSYICFDPIAQFSVNNEEIKINYPEGEIISKPILNRSDVLINLDEFKAQFESDNLDFKFIYNGLFGYMNYDAVRYFEDIDIDVNHSEIPDVYYAAYRYIIAIDHFKNETYLFSHDLKEENRLDEIEQIINSGIQGQYKYHNVGHNSTTTSDEEFKVLVDKAKEHCKRGDVFQLVLSRRFSQQFRGDEFNVYRALRSINPSPYLFYFDYGNFKIFGSSPEAQIIIKDDQAEIHPIAGTYKRTGNDEKDAVLARELAEDEKENAEHVMLVDLARNDLSRNGHAVEVKTYREVQYFSHVIHLVSKVIGKIKSGTSSLKIVADTFPAGTLSGAPKHMAMTLINKYESMPRGYYGGAIGFMDFKGNFNHAIMIRTFLSHQQKLHYQAGAGIVAASDSRSELQETYNKLGALNKALEIAENL